MIKKKIHVNCLLFWMVILILLSTIITMLSGCSRKPNESEVVIQSINDLQDKKIGVETGAVYDQEIRTMFPDAEIIYIESYSDAVVAMQNHKIDAFIADAPLAKFVTKEAGGLKCLPELLTQNEYAFIVKKGNYELLQEINTAIQTLDEEGILDSLKREWVDEEGTQEIEESPNSVKGEKVLKVITSANIMPFSYFENGEMVGYDNELITRIAEKMGYSVTIDNADFGTLITAVNSGKYDVAIGCITRTDERGETLAFTTPVYHSGAVAIVRDGTTIRKGFFETIGESFRKSFIEEDRWKMIGNGIWITLKISLSVLLIGTIGGFLFSYVLRSKYRAVRIIANRFCDLWDTIPIVVVLMLFYYILFKDVDISAMVIGITAFSIDFAVIVSGLIIGGIPTVATGEIEAAMAMGYKKNMIFRKIIMPQVVVNMFPQYKSSVVEMIKGTAIIGYITVEDLTKVSDIIRSRTFEAFFPLIMTAVIYFIISQLCIILLERISSNIQPKRRKRRVKGVK